jgi:hypothetical protein
MIWLRLWRIGIEESKGVNSRTLDLLLSMFIANIIISKTIILTTYYLSTERRCNYIMDFIEVVKNSVLFDDKIKTITSAIVISLIYWLAGFFRKISFPFVYIFKDNFSAIFLRLSTKEKIEALNIISSYKRKQNKYSIISDELRLKDYGLAYPIYTLRVLFHYIYDNNLKFNNIEVSSFLSSSSIFDFDRKSLPVFSMPKLITNIIFLTAFISLITHFIIDLFHSIGPLLSEPYNLINCFTLTLYIVFSIVMIRLIYLLASTMLAIFLAARFSKKLHKFFSSRP